MDDLNAVTDPRFELLSAYLDDEVSATERQQVEEWLATDADFHSQYLNLCRLQYGLRSLPHPHRSMSPEQAVENVMARANRKPKLIIWGSLGVATAAVVMGGIAGLFSGNTNPIPQTAQEPVDPKSVFVNPPLAEPIDPSELMIALDQPPVDVPVEASIRRPQPPSIPNALPDEF